MSINTNLQMQTTNRVTLKAKLATSSGEPLFGMEIKFYESTDAQTWSYIGSSYTNEEGEASVATEAHIGEYFKAVFEGTEEYEPSEATARFVLEEKQPPIMELVSETRKIWKALVIFGILTILLLIEKRK
jgi:5-hydroxyisourate hydrolase-like protein (transthyretin family)